jgi:hypothetical protein
VDRLRWVRVTEVVEITVRRNSFYRMKIWNLIESIGFVPVRPLGSLDRGDWLRSVPGLRVRMRSTSRVDRFESACINRSSSFRPESRRHQIHSQETECPDHTISKAGARRPINGSPRRVVLALPLSRRSSNPDWVAVSSQRAANARDFQGPWHFLPATRGLLPARFFRHDIHDDQGVSAEDFHVRPETDFLLGQ